MAASSSAAAGLLSRQLKQMQHASDVHGMSCGLVDDNVFEWEVMLMVSDECKYYGGALRARFRWAIPRLLPAATIAFGRGGARGCQSADVWS